MLPPAEAAKFKHYYDVDNEAILLFDPPKEMPGFGGNHLPSDKFQFNPNETYDGEDSPEAQDRPDLVCTLGGDGLLMHASNLFAGPCPPILCVAGGSLGFLTPFSRCEMVDAIRISLGLGQEKENGHDRAWLEDPSPKLPPPGETFDGSKDLKKNENKRPKFKFGANNQICLSMRMRLECQVINREGVVRARFNVLNEVVIDRGSSPYLAALECFCDDVHLTTVQADGVIFST
jgi:NAD+ kinase